jgi:osmotically-inducible protein OsmY
VRKALIGTLAEDASRLEVRARAGVVTLGGWVTNDAARYRAERTAHAVDAVEHVETQLRIVRAPESPRGM